MSFKKTNLHTRIGMVRLLHNRQWPAVINDQDLKPQTVV